MSNSSNHKGSTHGEFSVAISAGGDAFEYVRRWVSARESVDAFFHYCTSVAARTGLTREVRLTDGLDFCNMDWTYDEGIVFPREHLGRLRYGIDDSIGGSGVREHRSVFDPTLRSGRDNAVQRNDDSTSMESREAPEAGVGSGRDDGSDKG